MAEDVITEPLTLTVVPHDDVNVDGQHYPAGETATMPRLVAERLLLQGKAVAASGEAHDVFTELAEAAGGQVAPLVEEHPLPESAKEADALGKKHAAKGGDEAEAGS